MSNLLKNSLAPPSTSSSSSGPNQNNNNTASVFTPGTEEYTADPEIDNQIVTDIKGRYYYDKFGFTPFDAEKHTALRKAYVEGLAWNLKYYYEGCPSWEWYYPFHYGTFVRYNKSTIIGYSFFCDSLDSHFDFYTLLIVEYSPLIPKVPC
jgi:hypothetical protein